MQVETVILSQLTRLESKVDLILNGKPKEIITAKEAMALTGCRSVRAQYDWFRRHQLRPYEPGKYRRVDISNRVAALGIKANSKLN